MTFEVENDTQLLPPGKQRPQSTFLSMSPLFEEEKKDTEGEKKECEEKGEQKEEAK